MEKEIELEQEAIVVYSGGGAVSSVNGYTGDVVLTTSDLENTSDYQTGTEVESAISTAIAGKQDTLTAGNNITISNNTISATDTTYTAGTGLSLNGTEFSADTTVLATQNDLSSKQNTLTAGSNITISGDTISATDTTYSNFVGTDGTTAGTAGLVPAPATTDAGKFLKADGTWDTAGGGGGPTVVQTTGTSTTDVMSQKAVSGLIYADPGVAVPRQIRIGSTGNVSNSAIRIGYGGYASNTSVISIGASAQVSGVNGVAIGPDTLSTYRGSVALGSAAQTTVKGQVMVGTLNTYDGYNSSNYRIISGVYDPQSDHDAATKGYVDNSLLGKQDIVDNSLATSNKTVPGAINEVNNIATGKANKISVVQTSASTIEINSNTFYKFGEVASLNITLASITDNTIYNEYMFEFVSGTTATTLTLPSSIKWLETPTIDANKIYQCSIVDNIGILVGVTNV